MIDIQTVYTLDTVAVRSLELLTINPMVLSVVGDDFSGVSSVEINGTECDFNVVSTKSMLVTVPEELENTKFETINIFSVSPTITNSSVFTFRLGDNPNAVSGAAKLLQQFIKLLMTTPGTDMDYPNAGGGLLKFPGSRVNIKNPHSLIAKAVLAVAAVSDEMINYQNTVSLPPDEKLKSAEVLSVNYDQYDPTILEMSLRLNSFGNKSIVTSMLLDNKGN